MFSFALAYILYRVVMRYNKDRYAHFMELANRRINSMRVESLGLSQAYNNYGPGKRQEQLKRIKPQLDLIAGRLRVVANQDKLDCTGSNDTNHSTSSKKNEPVRVHPDGPITFDAKRLFDELDADGDGNLSYTELNAILELNGLQLTEFVRRMNDLGCVSANCGVVSRRVFLRHFVNVLAETSNFGPTKEEAQQLFDEIAKQGTNKHGDIEPAKFYTSSLSSFLSHTQINDLIVRLRSRQPERSTEFRLGSAEEFFRSVSDLTGGQRNRHGAIQREIFMAHYPQLLHDIATDPDPVPLLSSIRDGGCLELLGVDIAFEDLSLAVNVGGHSVKVVDQVTGRLLAGTMVSARMIGFVFNAMGFAYRLTLCMSPGAK
jgi:Ca2+-binding EF-hand superfamily protein